MFIYFFDVRSRTHAQPQCINCLPLAPGISGTWYLWFYLLIPVLKVSRSKQCFGVADYKSKCATRKRVRKPLRDVVTQSFSMKQDLKSRFQSAADI